MKTKATIPQSFYKLIACTNLLLAFFLGGTCAAQDAQKSSPFFLLSDAAYGSNDKAMVRLETQDMAAIRDQGGVDVYVYRVKRPLDFLKAQKNLHRINAEGNFVGAGISDALARSWDNWWNESRQAWRKLFSSDARHAVSAQAPGVRSHPLTKEKTPEQLNPLYRPLKSHTLVDSFRYPVDRAKEIQAPAGVALAGSSSEFIASPKGNVLIPLGKKEPGLYLIEAMVGEYRAVTLVFVSDAIAVTKVSSKQMMVWVADRRDSKPMPDAKTVWSDGVGVLGSGNTDKNGLISFNREAPEKTYVYGQDGAGGVFVAENYYYDSEIYNTKLYAVTDRPLYRPGETVFVKFIGRTFQSSRVSTPIAAGELTLQVFDAGGFPVAGKTLNLSPQTGGDTSFQLPDNAVAGGYELRFSYQGNSYGAAFRVAEYQKPHFEINVIPDKKDYKTKEEIKGKLQLLYPDGKPVMHASAELTVRAQRLSMIEGDLGYAGQFPVQLTTAKLSTDAKGIARFTLPAAAEPSRYIVSALATDGAAYRVRATKEILVERGVGTYVIRSGQAFSAPNETVNFNFRAQLATGVSSNALPAAASWDWVRLEDRATATGTIKDTDKFSINFTAAGTYTLSLRDSVGNIVGATSHFVSGGSIGAPQGSIHMVFNKSNYKAGETASAIITFPTKVDQALFTLERDAVEKTALMTQAEDWVRAKRLSPLQWSVEIPVKDDYGPNITFSVVYVKDGDYVFQNLGLKVEPPRIEVSVKSDKPVYQPGEKVTLNLDASLAGKIAPGSQLTVSVVDEMIYVLQPEIAPNVSDFFFHPRRNNVRTSASLSFITYDLAKPPSKLSLPSRSQSHERAIKVLERPRREDKDTAFWQANVATDAQGHAQVSFVMPDSLTRWRVTVRATVPTGEVGQNVAYVRSDKDFYIKWTSPDWLRSQDLPNASVAIFNQANHDATLELRATGAGLKQANPVTLKPGANFFSLPLAPTANDTRLELGLSLNNKTVDALAVALKVIPLNWQSQHSLSLPIAGKESPIKLPPDVSNIRLQFSDGANTQFRRIMDDLIDYPYGCVEQTSSRLIPYSIALQSLDAMDAKDERMAAQLSQRLHSYRFRLAQMAGPKAVFGWWGQPETEGDALLTAYAYYADWHASRALKLDLPPEHFNRLLDVYRSNGVSRSHWHRALMLYWMQEMGLPVRSMAQVLHEQISAQAGTNANSKAPAAARAVAPPIIATGITNGSAVLGQEENEVQKAMSAILAAYVVEQTKGKLLPTSQASLDVAAKTVQSAGIPMGDALLMLSGKRALTEAPAVLERVKIEQATIDRSLALLWTYRALSSKNTGAMNSLMHKRTVNSLEAPWQALESATGQAQYAWPLGTPAPDKITVVGAVPSGLNAVVKFDSREIETTSLPLKIERHIYRLSRKSEDESTVFAPVLLTKDAVLKTDEVYLDEIVLTQTSGAPLLFGLLEVPLPPGVAADRSTWGINLQFGDQAATALERARYELTPRGYAVPIDRLAGSTVIRHLIRAAQPGKFVLPPARYYRMYQPAQKAFEEKARASITIR